MSGRFPASGNGSGAAFGAASDDLTGRRFVITGANSGLGLATATALSGRGAEVVLAVRDLDRGRTAMDRVRHTVPQARLELARIDLASLASIQEFAAGQLRHGPLHGLINNAGVSMLQERTLTEDGFELQMGTNFLGHFALTALLMPALQRADRGRVVSLSSMVAWIPRSMDTDFGDTGPYRRAQAYCRSKLACGIFGVELDRRLKAGDSAVTSVVAHPGWVRTDLFARGSDSLTGAINWFTGRLAAPVASGARSQVYAATAPELSGGEFIGPRLMSHGRPERVRPPRLMADPQLGADLWKAAEERTGVSFEDDAAA